MSSEPRRIFKTRPFARWARRCGLDDSALRAAVREMEGGLVDADLGGGLIKKRVRLPGRGKRAGARVVVATNRRDRWYFVLGFAKNERENIDNADRVRLVRLAWRLIGLSDFDLAKPEWQRELEEL